jgi:hypothetical protein
LGGKFFGILFGRKPNVCNPIIVVFSAAGENAEFLFLELVASGIVCCIQLSNRAVERVGVGLRMTEDFICPITMVWPPVFPVLN